MTAAAAVAKAAENAEDITSLNYRIVGSLPKRGRVSAEASMKTEPLAMSMKLTTAGQSAHDPLEIRFVDGVIYAGGSAVASPKLNGKNWLRADPAVWGRGGMDNNTYGVVPTQIEPSPVVQSTILTGSKDVRSIGTETVEGTRTTHYRGTVTSSGLGAARDAAKDKATRQRQIDSLDQFMVLSLGNTLTMDLWIDGDNHAKQFRMRGEKYDVQGGTGGGPLDMTITFLEINQPVTIETPPAKDTTDLGALVDAAQAG
ncbi:hypothetical protein [Streptomyces sp. SID12488]|uniref:hypothetical protein n=1 Tax=Streptomyces sp. SID12488 TaxID=2706040 RepID=UPI0013DAB1E2|nr:hypothetical protein [Streptomyces sp. SID12488]